MLAVTGGVQLWRQLPATAQPVLNDLDLHFMCAYPTLPCHHRLGNGPFNYKALAPPSEMDAAGLYASSGNNSNDAALESMSQALAQANDALMQLTNEDSNTQVSMCTQMLAGAYPQPPALLCVPK